jgi:hypothetical protein
LIQELKHKRFNYQYRTKMSGDRRIGTRRAIPCSEEVERQVAGYGRICPTPTDGEPSAKF